MARNENNGTAIQWYDAVVLSSQQYYPFGMLMPGSSDPGLRRQYSLGGYDHRYGFNGKEGDDEVKGDDNQVDFGGRILDPRVGRWMSVDPMVSKYANVSPYVFGLNDPIYFIDPDGMDVITPFKNLKFLNTDTDKRSKIILAQTKQWTNQISRWQKGGDFDKVGIDLNFSFLVGQFGPQGKDVPKIWGKTTVSVFVGEKATPLENYSGDGTDIKRYQINTEFNSKLDVPTVLLTASHEIGTHANTYSEQIIKVTKGEISFKDFQNNYTSIVNSAATDPLNYRSPDHDAIGNGTATLYNSLLDGIITKLRGSRNDLNIEEKTYEKMIIRNNPESQGGEGGYGSDGGKIERHPYTHEVLGNKRASEKSRYEIKK